MKKIILVAAVGMLALVSCKKDYSCDCETAGISTPVEIKNSSKSDATDACDKLNTAALVAGGKCELK